MKTTVCSLALAGTLLVALPATAEDGTFALKLMTPETALKAAQAALKSCRDQGYQVAVAVVDRMGVAQVMLRDRFAGTHTPKTAIGKAFTAVSFRTDTTELVETTQPGKPSNGIRNLPNVVVVGGGLKIEAAGSIIGGIGVSGAPGGDKDDVCAKAGIAAIKDLIDF
ncbi:MAG: heme-binding protein [Rhodospirillales bacterium]|nr:heme-binding protein [Rhodospirillales bacterium]